MNSRCSPRIANDGLLLVSPSVHVGLRGQRPVRQTIFLVQLRLLPPPPSQSIESPPLTTATAAAAPTSASPNHSVSTVIVRIRKARVIEMRAAGHFRLLHGFLLRRLSTTIAAAAAGQFVSVPALPSRDPLLVLLLQPIQSFTHCRRASEFGPTFLSPDCVPLLLVGGDFGAGNVVIRAVADVSLLFLHLTVVDDRLVPQAGVSIAATTVRQIEPSKTQIQRRHVCPVKG